MRMILAAAALVCVAGCHAQAGKGASIAPDTLVVVTDGQEQIPYGQIASGGLALEMAHPPVAFEELVTTSACRTPKARSGAKAAYVYTYGGGDHVPLQHVNFKDTPEQAAERRRMIQAAKSGIKRSAMTSEFAAFQAGNAVEWASRIDVLVTETSAPVFLYLSSYDPIFWNIQLAPGARIDGIVVNSYDAGAIANGVDAGRTAIVSFANSPARTCYAQPPVRTIPVAQRIAAARKINPDFELSAYQRSEWEADYRKGQTYFSDLQKMIGKRPDWILTNSHGRGFKAVLVGPAPAAAFPIQPITRLQIPAHITPFWGARDAAFKQFGLQDVT